MCVWWTDASYHAPIHLPIDTSSPLTPSCIPPRPRTGIWALWTYRLSHVLWQRELLFVSRFVPRLAMSVVRYITSVDIHPAAKISGTWHAYLDGCLHSLPQDETIKQEARPADLSSLPSLTTCPRNTRIFRTEGGVMLDHACGVVIGATAEVGARTVFYHQVKNARKQPSKQSEVGREVCHVIE